MSEVDFDFELQNNLIPLVYCPYLSKINNQNLYSDFQLKYA